MRFVSWQSNHFPICISNQIFNLENSRKRPWLKSQDVKRTTASSAARDQKMRILAERGHYKLWSASWYVASYYQISGCNVISSHFLIWVIFPGTWYKPIMENFFNFHWTCKNCLSMAILKSDLFHGTMHHPTNLQADSGHLYRVRAVMFSVGPNPSPSWQIVMFHGKRKNGQAWQFYIATCFLVLCTNGWNFERVRVVASFCRPGPSLSGKISAKRAKIGRA